MDFDRVYQELFTPLYRYVVIRVRNEDEALDIVQEVFTRVYEKYREKPFDELGRVLYQSARNLIIDRSRKKKSLELDGLTGVVESIADEGLDPIGVAQNSEDRELVRQMVGMLDTTDQEIVMLRYFQDLDYQEISNRLEVTPDAVRKRLSRSMKKLSEQLHEWYESHES